METIGNLIFLGILVLLVFYGKKLMSRKSTIDEGKEKDFMQELRDINNIKIDVVPSKEIYGFLFGGCVWLFVYYCVVGMLSSHPAGFPLLGGVVDAVLMFPISICFFIFYFWYYTYFRKAIAPNMRYGNILLRKLHKLVFVLAIINALIVLFVSLVSSEPFIGFFLGLLISLWIGGVAINFELQRLGVPNFLQGVKNIVKSKN